MVRVYVRTYVRTCVSGNSQVHTVVRANSLSSGQAYGFSAQEPSSQTAIPGTSQIQTLCMKWSVDST